jgi:hypothetical protein
MKIKMQNENENGNENGNRHGTGNGTGTGDEAGNGDGGGGQAGGRRSPHRHIRRAILAHFAGAGAPRREREMRAHLPGCVDCRAFYEDCLLVASLDPAAPSDEERIARGLGLPVRRAPGRALFLNVTALAGMAAAAVVLFAVVRPTRNGDHGGTPAPAGASGEKTGGFVARGAADARAPELVVYRIAAGGGAPEAAAEVIHPGDEVAFAYRNPTGKRRLLVFAVDEHGHVYWYHPGWVDSGNDPTAVAISPEPGLHELPAAVAQRYDGERLRVHALFTDQEITVRQVEAALAAPTGSAGEERQERQEREGREERREWPFFETTDVIREIRIAPGQGP